MRFYIVILIVFLFHTSCISQNVDEMKHEMISVLELPDDIIPVETVDEWFPNGDGYYLARYSLEESLFKRLKQQTESNSEYAHLPFGDEIIDNLIFDYVSDEDKGVYELIYNKNDPRDIKMTLLNESKKELIIFISFQ